jgi:Leucine-rich repeat (LRR) protein
MTDLWFSKYPLQIIIALQQCNNTIPMTERDEFLTSIELLNLAEMELKEVPDFIKDMKNLKFLDLSFNQIMDVDKECFPSNLRVLNLSDNQLLDLDFADIVGSVRMLEQVYLMNNKLMSLPKNLGMCRSLLELDMSGNQIEVLKYDGEFPENMISLIVMHNKITSVELGDRQLKYLSSISLSGNKLEEMPEVFLNQRRLKNVNLMKNPIVDWDVIMRSRTKGKKVLY